jgi:predicted membrane channel-forming protein YqfA (hemolysin III family)
VGAVLRILREIFDDRLTRAAGIVFIVIVALVVFNIFSNLTQTHPLLGVLLFSLVPLLFIVGGVIFVVAIIRS